MTPAGALDPTHGIRTFNVGTGGESVVKPTVMHPNSEVADSVFGVLKLSLSADHYDWQFVPMQGMTFADAGSTTCHAKNHPPTAVSDGPYSGTAGTATSFDGSGSSDPDNDALTYKWTFGDESTSTVAKPSHTYAAAGTYTVTLTVTDPYGASSSATTTATLAPSSLTVNAGSAQTLDAGNPITFTAGFSDPGVTGPWGYTLDFGDGSTPITGSATSQTALISAVHSYTDAGAYAAQLTVTDPNGASGTGTRSITVSTPTTVTLVGAGNIGRCGTSWLFDEATSAILDTVAGTVFTAGDGAHDQGTLDQYNTCYGPSWGRHKDRTSPAIGHRDILATATADGYFGYYGAAAAGDPTKGYYSYDRGAWHIIVLNSNTSDTTTAAGMSQHNWLKADLAASATQCQLAIFHQPRMYSRASGPASPSGVGAFWKDLYAAGAELIVNAHMRQYERFAPQTPGGVADANGIREIIVGTGGEGLDADPTFIAANSEARKGGGVYGVLKLTLGDGTYSWQFIPVAGETFTDSGSGTCH